MAISSSYLLTTQGSADSNFSQPSSDLSLDEEREVLRRETERQALTQLEKARVRKRFFDSVLWSWKELVGRTIIS